MQDTTLVGTRVRLEPLRTSHAEPLSLAASEDRALYRWSAVPEGYGAFVGYVEAALALRRSGRALPFAIVDRSDDSVIGSTRFFDLERLAWPLDHPRASLTTPDVGEIGYTWLAARAVRTAANTEAKLLLLSHAFETLGMLRVCFHTDARNERSARALERIGARFEGTLRAHRMATDARARDSKRYSIVAAEWPDLKVRLTEGNRQGS